MASNTVSVYLKSPLYEKVKQAHADKTININEVCAKALEEALAPGLILPGATAPVPALVEAVDLSNENQAAELASQASELEYQISYSDSPTAAQAFLDHIAAQGAWPVSLTPTMDGKFCVLVAWPKVLTEQP